jgi:AraC family transcriptional regulator
MLDPSHPAVSLFSHRSYAAHSDIAPHMHSSPSLTLVLGGAYEERIAGRSAPQGEGSALICPEGMSHAQRFGARGARKIIVTPGPVLLDYLKTATPFAAAPSARSATIGRLARQIGMERSLADAFSDAAMEGALWQVAALLGRSIAGASTSASSIARRARRLIEAAGDEPIPLAILCRETNCHPATLTRAFRRDYGCTPGEYQRRLRVERAGRLLRDTVMPLAEVAATCGFCDQSHLARSFRQVLGCTPSDYRRRA